MQNLKQISSLIFQITFIFIIKAFLLIVKYLSISLINRLSIKRSKVESIALILLFVTSNQNRFLHTQKDEKIFLHGINYSDNVDK